jgi:hypothetical protein
MGPEELDEWEDLMKALGEVNLNQAEDKILWGLSANKIFSTSSLYRFMTSGGVSSNVAKKIWKCKIPLKIRIFLWKAFHNRIQVANQLKLRNWKGNEFCVLYGEREDINHIIFSCPLFGFVWIFMSEVLGWDDFPRSMEELIGEWLPGNLVSISNQD